MSARCGWCLDGFHDRCTNIRHPEFGHRCHCPEPDCQRKETDQ